LNAPLSVFGHVDRVAAENGLGPGFDGAMLTTMTFQEMFEHKGGEMYDAMMMKTKSWRSMCRSMTDRGTGSCPSPDARTGS
jgi:hypothetical protein